MRRWFSFKHRARWVALLACGLPIAGIMMAVVVPRAMDDLRSLW
jgi:hypothetical protein